MCRMKMRRVENGNVYIYQDKVLLYELYSNLYMFLMYISLVYFYIVCKIKNKIFDVGLVIFFNFWYGECYIVQQKYVIELYYYI